MLSKDQFAEMNARLEEIENREGVLIQSLRDRLTSVDRKLLDNVRNLATEHETRRTMILSELQVLAERIGAFPACDESPHVIEGNTIDAPVFVPQDPPHTHATPNGGDWRKAAEKIRDEFEQRLNGAPTANGAPQPQEPIQPGRLI